MTKTRSDLVVVRDDRDGSDLGGVIYGYNTPRIHSPLNDLPSKGSELSQFATEIGLPLLPWQEWIAEMAHKVKPDGRWKHSNICVVVARQNGKSTLMMVRIMAGMYLWNDGLQIGSAHRLTTSLETFRHIVNLIESNDRLADEVKKFVGLMEPRRLN
jgi:phage terminase large subunit-like protein